MKRSVRPWFYLACLVAWIVVGLGPGVYRFNVEQDKLDDAFYANMSVPPPQDLFESAIRLGQEIVSVKTWDEYGRVLEQVSAHELYIRKYSRLHRAEPWEIDAIQRANFRVADLRRQLSMKMNEMQERRRKGGVAMGAFPEEGFTRGMGIHPPMASWSHYWTALWTSWVFAFLILIVRLDAEGYNVALELVTPWWLLLATLVWPVGLFKYPNGDPGRQLIRGLRFATFTLAACLGMAPAAATAQTKGGKDNKKSSPYAFTIEARNVRVVGPDPKPEAVVKSTITTPSGWVAQTTQAQSKGFWSNTSLFGHILFKNGVARVDAVAGISRNSAGATAVPIGIVGSVNRPRWQSFFPYAGYERRLDKPAHHAVVANQTLLKLGAWRVGAETFFKKATGAKQAWYAGGVLARTLGKKGYAEAIAYRNQSGEWRLRGRLAYAHSW